MTTTTIEFTPKTLDRIKEVGERLKEENQQAQDASEKCGKEVREAEPSVQNLVRKVMNAHFPRLVQLGVTVRAMMAYAARDENGDVPGDAIKQNGVALLG